VKQINYLRLIEASKIENFSRYNFLEEHFLGSVWTFYVHVFVAGRYL